MNINELKGLNLNNIGTAPVWIKGLLLIFTLVLIGFLGFHFIVKGQRIDLDKVKAEESTLKATFENKYHKSVNLEVYKAQLDEMRTDFGTMLRQLPGESEIPGVVVDVSQTGLGSGLDIVLFKPEAEIEKGFYAEKPITIKVNGSFEEMAKFASGIAELPRIVTLHNISLLPSNKGKKGKKTSSVITTGQELTMSVTAKTYRYLEDHEQDQQQDQQGSGG